MSKITVSAPGKLLLLGDHAVVHGYPCLVTAVDQRIFVTATTLDQPHLQLDAPDLKVENYRKPITELGQGDVPKAVSFIEHACYRFWQQYPQTTGIHITTHSQFSSQFGFGSSSASTVAVIKSLAELFGLSLTNYQLFELCYQVVLDIQGVGSGFDLAAAIWGGTLLYVSPAKVVRPLTIDHLPLIVGYTGIKADTATLIKQVNKLYVEQPDKVGDIFRKSEWLVLQAEKALVTANWPVVGELMTHNQKLLSELGVSSPELNRLIDAAMQSGADGAKLSGAGGGDCMIALASENQRHQVESGIAQAGGQIMSVTCHAAGVRIEKN